ncbi:unnamed protein product [Arctogadus glacialis]
MHGCSEGHVAGFPGRTGDRPVDPARLIGARLSDARISPEPQPPHAPPSPRTHARPMELTDGDGMDKPEDMSSVYEFDPITGNIPATKVEITVSCR